MKCGIFELFFKIVKIRNIIIYFKLQSNKNVYFFSTQMPLCRAETAFSHKLFPLA